MNDPVTGAFAVGSWGWLGTGGGGGGRAGVGRFSDAYASAHGSGLGEAAEAYSQHVGTSRGVACGLEYPYRNGAGRGAGGGLGGMAVAWQVGPAAAGLAFGLGGQGQVEGE